METEKEPTKKKRKTRTKANGEGTIWTEKRNNKTYYRGAYVTGYDANGKPKRKLFSSYKKQDVIDAMAEYKTLMNKGLTSSDDKIMLEDYFRKWLFEYRKNDLKDTTFTKYDSIYRNHVKDSAIGKVKLVDLRKDILQRHYNNLIEEGISLNVIKTINKHLGTCLEQAFNDSIIPRNYCRMVTLPKVQSNPKDEDIKFFSMEEQKTFISSLNSHRNKALFILAFGAGLRIGELMALTWDNIDMDTKSIIINSAISHLSIVDKKTGNRTWSTIEHDPKTSTSFRTVPLPDTVFNELMLHKERQDIEKSKLGYLYQDNNLVFATETGNYIDTRNLTRSYERALAKANIPYRSFHSMRHTYATRLFEKDVPVKTVQVLMGHKDITTTMNIYTHVMPEKKTAEVQCLNDIFS